MFRHPHLYIPIYTKGAINVCVVVSVSFGESGNVAFSNNFFSICATRSQPTEQQFMTGKLADRTRSASSGRLVAVIADNRTCVYTSEYDERTLDQRAAGRDR